MLNTRQYTFTFCIATELGMFTLDQSAMGADEHHARQFAKIKAKKRAKDCFGDNVTIGNKPKFKSKTY